MFKVTNSIKQSTWTMQAESYRHSWIVEQPTDVDMLNAQGKPPALQNIYNTSAIMNDLSGEYSRGCGCQHLLRLCT